MDRFIIMGAGGHGKEVLNIIVESYPQKKVSLFDNLIKKRQMLFGFIVYTYISHLEK